MEKEQRQKYWDKADAVGKVLGLTLRESDPCDWQRRFDYGEHGTLYFTVSRNINQSTHQPQLYVGLDVAFALNPYRPSYWRSKDGDQPVTTMNVDVEKEATVIAYQIKRRIVPEYERLLALVLSNKIAEHLEKTTTAASYSALASAIPGCKVYHNHEGTPRSMEWKKGNLGVGVSAEVKYPGNTVSLNIGMPIEIAVELLGFIHSKFGKGDDDES